MPKLGLNSKSRSKMEAGRDHPTFCRSGTSRGPRKRMGQVHAGRELFVVPDLSFVYYILAPRVV